MALFPDTVIVKGVCLFTVGLDIARVMTYLMNPLASTKVRGIQVTITTVLSTLDLNTLTFLGVTAGTEGRGREQEW